MTRPPYRKARKPVTIGLHTVMTILQEIERLGHHAALQMHLEAAGASVTVPPATINFLKDYLATNALHQDSAIVTQIMTTDPNADPDCCQYKDP